MKTSPVELENPFGDYGNLVHGDRFIGRQGHLREIASRVIRSPGGNLSIVGQRRVGKSSLAYQAVMTRRDYLLSQRIIPFRVSLGTYDTPQRFFCDMAAICFRELENLGWTSRLIREAAEEIKTRSLETFDFAILKEFFDQTQAAGIRVIFLLDEFDEAISFFESDIHFFDRLRELSYRGQTTLITISRDPLTAIERRANISSTLIGICDDRTLAMFEDSEIEVHVGRLKSVGITLSSEHQQQIHSRCGGHPYLRDKVAFELVELFRNEGKINLAEAFHRSERVFQREFDSIVRHLHDRGFLESLMHALFAAPVDAESSDLKELENYGLIRHVGSRFEAFCASFQEHLRQELPVLIEDLTQAEHRVLHCLTSDMQNKEIATELNLSAHTVKSHIANILRKLKAKGRHEAVRRAREREIIE